MSQHSALSTQHLITLINGDGIGQEVIPAARTIIEALDLPIAIQTADAGFGTFERVGDALPPETLKICAASDAILFGATQSPMTKVAGYRSPILSLRRHFDLFANLRPAVQATTSICWSSARIPRACTAGANISKTTATPPSLSA